MRRPEPPLDPDVARELAELEAALADDVRAVAPVADPGFLTALEERVVDGFPRPSRARRAAPRRRRLLLLAAPVAGAAHVAALVAGAVLRGGGAERAVPGASLQSGRAGEADSGGGGADSRLASPPAVAPTAAAGGGAVTPAERRRVERSASVTLAPPADEIQEVADGVAAAATVAGGYVAGSQVTTGSREGSASLQLRVPSARLAVLLARLRDLAPVESLTQAADDITGATGVAAERVADARAERRALLRAQGPATTEREIATLRERLRLNRSRLAAAKGTLEALRRRARLATVDVAVHARRDGGGAGAWTPRDALGDALRVLEVAAGVALVGAAALVPLLLLALPVALLARASVRRRRERALAGV